MIPITPIPRAPPYISGVINLRGEITNIMNLNTLLGLPPHETRENQKIIVLVPDAAFGFNRISKHQLAPGAGSSDSHRSGVFCFVDSFISGPHREFRVGFPDASAGA
jgi:hypothetical protein